MTFYCDKLRHMVCVPYSIENLHVMAQKLGIKRHWFHVDHYDMPKLRVEELKEQCVVVHPFVILNIIKGKMKRHSVTITIEKLEATIYIEAKELKVISHERIIADNVVIDLPGNITHTSTNNTQEIVPLTEPVISIDRASKSYAIFNNGVELVRAFRPYTDEQEAVDEAMAWCAQRTAKKPRLVYPNVTKMKASS